MSKTHPINADEATKAAVVAYAAERGISQTKALAEMVRTAVTQEHHPQTGLSLLGTPALTTLLKVALERSQSPAETLSAALDALASRAVVVDGWVWEWLTKRAEAQDGIWGANRGSIVKHLIDFFMLHEVQPLSPAIVQPASKQPPRDEHGEICRCDGLAEPGPHHRLGCARRTA